jgi:hypothetical protein
LTALTRLNLYGNKLTGTIPSSIGTKLSSLIELSLNHNALTGSVPRELTKLTQLTHIAISSNPHITGEWSQCSRCRCSPCIVGIALALITATAALLVSLGLAPPHQACYRPSTFRSSRANP